MTELVQAEQKSGTLGIRVKTLDNNTSFYPTVLEFPNGSVARTGGKATISFGSGGGDFVNFPKTGATNYIQNNGSTIQQASYYVLIGSETFLKVDQATVTTSLEMPSNETFVPTLYWSGNRQTGFKDRSASAEIDTWINGGLRQYVDDNGVHVSGGKSLFTGLGTANAPSFTFENNNAYGSYLNTASGYMGIVANSVELLRFVRGPFILGGDITGAGYTFANPAPAQFYWKDTTAPIPFFIVSKGIDNRQFEINGSSIVVFSSITVLGSVISTNPYLVNGGTVTAGLRMPDGTLFTGTNGIVGGSAPGDNLGSHIATQPVTMAFGVTASSAIVIGTANVQGNLTSTGNFVLNGGTLTAGIRMTDGTLFIGLSSTWSAIASFFNSANSTMTTLSVSTASTYSNLTSTAIQLNRYMESANSTMTALTNSTSTLFTNLTSTAVSLSNFQTSANSTMTALSVSTTNERNFSANYMSTTALTIEGFKAIFGTDSAKFLEVSAATTTLSNSTATIKNRTDLLSQATGYLYSTVGTPITVVGTSITAVAAGSNITLSITPGAGGSTLTIAASASGGGSGDNFGSHTATKPVNMNNFGIDNTTAVIVQNQIAIGTEAPSAILQISTSAEIKNPIFMIFSTGSTRNVEMTLSSWTLNVSTIYLNGTLVISTGNVRNDIDVSSINFLNTMDKRPRYQSNPGLEIMASSKTDTFDQSPSTLTVTFSSRSYLYIVMVGSCALGTKGGDIIVNFNNALDGVKNVPALYSVSRSTAFGSGGSLGAANLGAGSLNGNNVSSTSAVGIPIWGNDIATATLRIMTMQVYNNRAQDYKAGTFDSISIDSATLPVSRSWGGFGWFSNEAITSASFVLGAKNAPKSNGASWKYGTAIQVYGRDD